MYNFLTVYFLSNLTIFPRKLSVWLICYHFPFPRHLATARRRRIDRGSSLVPDIRRNKSFVQTSRHGLERTIQEVNITNRQCLRNQCRYVRKKISPSPFQWRRLRDSASSLDLETLGTMVWGQRTTTSSRGSSWQGLSGSTGTRYSLGRSLVCQKGMSLKQHGLDHWRNNN